MTMPELLHDPIRAVGGDPEALVPMQRLDPAYRAVYPDGSELHIRADMGDLREEIRTKVGEADAAGFDRFLVWLEHLYETEFATFVDRNYSSPLDLVRSPATAARLLRLGGLGALGAGRRPVLHRRPAHPDLQLPGPVCRHRAGEGPRRAGRHHLHGHRARRLLPRGRHARGAPRHGAGADRRRRARAPGRRGERGAAPLRRRRRRGRHQPTANASPRTPSCAPSTYPSPTTGCCRAWPRRAPCAPAPSRRPPSCGTWAPQARPAPHLRHHNIHFGDDWDGAFEAIIDRGELMPDPSRLVTVPIGHRPDRRPPGSTADVRAGTGAAHRSRPRLGARGRPDARAAARLPRGRWLPRPTSARSCSSRPTTGAPRGCTSARPFALAHTFLQSGPFRPSNVDRRVPGLVFAGSGTQPGVGIPMVLVSGKLAAQRVQEYAGAARPVPRTVVR